MSIYTSIQQLYSKHFKTWDARSAIFSGRPKFFPPAQNQGRKAKLVGKEVDNAVYSRQTHELTINIQDKFKIVLLRQLRFSIVIK